ncbi:PREDICTED: LOW QUALITY PROTEIN: phosphatidylinositol N-acetylglucosaminyltransferase subunit H [Nipponia nippon]|uniref:LOW QUALITY PROTEIN: phosphatidylinositol N-acetylglucosaminyltransferase subunit H n=1 Tax=Nipponia nippon TaxID=128390 RepID=UPI00051082E7|nr:PREDICTED: LOW QUALITY PROTEIN: phosphatidylinositol N-acetylglucosaminyltransferase subunit H [Nipponia nippon]
MTDRNKVSNEKVFGSHHTSHANTALGVPTPTVRGYRQLFLGSRRTPRPVGRETRLSLFREPLAAPGRLLRVLRGRERLNGRRKLVCDKPPFPDQSSVFAWLVLQNSMVLSAAIFITLIGLIIYLHFVKIDQESLLVIGSLIEMGQVKDVVINEAIHMQKVIYYLCILLQDPGDPQGVSEVVPLFQSSKPRLDCLIEVYKSCQEILEQRRTAPQSSGIK